MQAARVLWDRDTVQVTRPPCQRLAIDQLMDKWHSQDRRQANFFLEGPPKDTVGAQLTTKWVDTALLVRTSRSASRWSARVQATKWCVRILQELYKGIELPKAKGKIMNWVSKLQVWASDKVQRA